MTSKQLFEHYRKLRKTDPAAAEQFARQHMGNELFAAGLKFQEAVSEAASSQQGSGLAQAQIQQHELFPAAEMPRIRSACGDSHDE